MKNNLVIFPIIVLLSSCSLLPSKKNEVVIVKTEIAESERWWDVYDDYLMSRLAEKLLQQNLDIKIAETRVLEARALADISSSSLYPDVSLNASSGRSNTDSIKVGTISQGGFQASWELDVFGANAASKNASEARLKASEISVIDAKNIVLSELFRAIIQWHQAEQTLRETKQLLAAQDDQVKLFEARVKSGLVDATYLERATAQKEQTATQIPLAMASSKAAQYQIEKLMGLQPEAMAKVFEIAKKDYLVVPEPKEVFDIKIDIIKSRPDVRASYYQLIASNKDLEKAEADIWPKINLSTFFGIRDVSENVITAENPVWSLTSAVTMPLLNFGRLQGAIDAADAKSKRAALEYQNQILIAMQEAKTALSDYLNGVNAVSQQQKALEHRKQTVELAKDRFERGLTDMTDLTTAQAELDQATILLINRKADAAIAYIRLQKALGK